MAHHCAIKEAHSDEDHEPAFAREIVKGDYIRTMFGTLDRVERVVPIPQDNVIYFWFDGHTESFTPWQKVVRR